MDAIPTPHVEKRDGQLTVGVTRTVSMDTIAGIADRIPEVIAAVLTAGGELAGPPYLRYHVIDMAREFVVEAGVPVVDGPGVGAALAAHPDLERGQIPGGRYVVVVHHGPPTGLAAATGALLEWAAAEGLTFDTRPAPDGETWGGRFEFYLTNPAEVAGPDEWDTELAFRLAG